MQFNLTIYRQLHQSLLLAYKANKFNFFREAIVTILILVCVIVITVVGNILVILSVLTHTPLKILSNYYVVSLAVADLTVGNTHGL